MRIVRALPPRWGFNGQTHEIHASPRALCANGLASMPLCLEPCILAPFLNQPDCYEAVRLLHMEIQLPPETITGEVLRKSNILRTKIREAVAWT